MNSDAIDHDPQDDDHETPRRAGRSSENSNEGLRGRRPKDGGPMEDSQMDGAQRDGGKAGWMSIDIVKLFARYKAGDFNEKAAREVADVFRELSDATVTTKAGKTNEMFDDSVLKNDSMNVREGFSDLKDDFYGLKDDYFDLKDDYLSLKESYFNIKDEYTTLKSEYIKLKELYLHDLEDEKIRIQTKVKSLKRKVRIYFLLLLIMVLLSSSPSMDFIYKLFGLH